MALLLAHANFNLVAKRITNQTGTGILLILLLNDVMYIVQSAGGSLNLTNSTPIDSTTTSQFSTETLVIPRFDPFRFRTLWFYSFWFNTCWFTDHCLTDFKKIFTECRLSIFGLIFSMTITFFRNWIRYWNEIFTCTIRDEDKFVIIAGHFLFSRLVLEFVSITCVVILCEVGQKWIF